MKPSDGVDEPIIDWGDAGFPVRPDFGAAHARYWGRLRRPGAFWTGPERVAIANEARAAHDCPLCQARRAALSPNSVDGEHHAVSTLPAAAVEAVHRIVTDASRLTRRWYGSLLEAGLTEGHYVELVGTVVAVVSIDAFALALGVANRPLPAPLAGDPSGYRPATAGADDAWVPMVAVDNAGTPEADLWPSGSTGNVVRAMSLVPDEVRTLKDLSAAHYLPMARVRVAGDNDGRVLTRSQMELVAGRTSALNACYY